MMGIILAAGRGIRLGPFSRRWPKAMLPVLGKPLVVHHIESLRDSGVRHVIIVIGHLGAELTQTLGDGSVWGVEIEYVEQAELLGIAHALGTVEAHVDRPFYLLLGDIFAVGCDLRRMGDLLSEPGVHAVLAVKEEEDSAAIRRNFVVIQAPDGSVTRVIEKPRFPQTRIKGCGIYAFEPVIFDAVRRTPRTAGRDEYEITESIQILIDDGHAVRAAHVIEDDLNITTPRDLLDINLQMLEEDVLLGDGVEVAEGAHLERSVIMDRVVIEHPITVSESLVLPDTVVSARQDIRHQVLTPEVTIDCG